MEWDVNSQVHVYSTYEHSDGSLRDDYADLEEKIQLFIRVILTLRRKELTDLHISWILSFYNFVSGSHPWLCIRITWSYLKDSLSPTPNQLSHC